MNYRNDPPIYAPGETPWQRKDRRDRVMRELFVRATDAIPAGRVGSHKLYDIRRDRQHPWRFLFAAADLLVWLGVPTVQCVAIADAVRAYVVQHCADRDAKAETRSAVVGSISPNGPRTPVARALRRPA